MRPFNVVWTINVMGENAVDAARKAKACAEYATVFQVSEHGKLVGMIDTDGGESPEITAQGEENFSG